MLTWTYQDYLDEKCEASDVGERKPPAPAEVVPLDTPLSDLLATNSREVYIELGGKDYLRRNPALLNKVLLKQVEPDNRTILEANTARLQGIRDEMPWVSARRLMYQMEGRLAEDIVPKDRAAPGEPAPSEPAAEAVSTAATPLNSISDTRVAPTAPRAPTPLPSETADIRKEYGSRGNARHK